MARMVLYFRGPGAAPAEALNRLRSLPGVRVVEETDGRLILLDGPEALIRAAVADLPGWSVSPETRYAPPGCGA